jgi:hypothetical protein
MINPSDLPKKSKVVDKVASAELPDEKRESTNDFVPMALMH